MGAHEARRDRRYDVNMPALLVAGQKAREVTVLNVSFRGVMVATESTPRLRDLVRVRMVLPPGGEPLDVQATVVRVTPGAEGAPATVGLQFFALTPETATLWRHFIDVVRQAAGTQAAPVSLDATPPATRRFQRFTMVLQVRLESCGQIHGLFSQDLSLGGVFLDTTLPLPVGEKVVVQLIHPQTLAPFDLEGVIRRRVKEGAMRGAAVEFTGLTPARRGELMDFICGAARHMGMGTEVPIEIEV